MAHRKEEINRSKEETTIISLDKDVSLQNHGFNHLKKDEYERDGHRYDIIKKEHKAGKVIYHLVHDSYEDSLLTYLQSYFNGSSNQRKSNVKPVSPLSNVKISTLSEFRFDIQSHNLVGFLTNDQHITPSQPFLSIVTPPPKRF